MNPVHDSVAWVRTNKAMLLMILTIIIFALIPLYGVLYPPVVDMGEHILVSKLLWEKLTGTSHLELTISWFLGYRLFPLLMLTILPFFNLFQLEPSWLPGFVASTLISIHVIVIVAVLSFQLQDKSSQSLLLTGCFVLLPVAGMYSATWFLGFVNYTLAITLLVPAIFVTERFLRTGKWNDAGWLVLLLAMVYIAHPFAPTYWVLWMLGRSVGSLLTQAMTAEWKRIGITFALLLPIILYHCYWMPNTAADSPRFLLTQPPLLSLQEWYRDRLYRLFSGYYLKVDNASESTIFNICALGFILLATIIAFCSPQAAPLRKMAVANLFIAFIPSGLNEKLFPLPTATWLAYDRRWSLTVYVVCLTIAAAVFIRSLPSKSGWSLQKIAIISLAIVTALASLNHLRIVRRGYVNFDQSARKWMVKVLANETPTGITMPATPWHLDGTFVKHYRCLEGPDCVPEGSFFSTGYAADLFPVRLPPLAQRMAPNKAPTGPPRLQGGNATTPPL